MHLPKPQTERGRLVIGHNFQGHSLLLKSQKTRPDRSGKTTWVLKNLCSAHCGFTIYFYFIFISPVPHESKPQTERDRPAKLAINSRDTLYCRKVKRSARTSPARPHGGLKLKLGTGRNRIQSLPQTQKGMADKDIPTNEPASNVFAKVYNSFNRNIETYSSHCAEKPISVALINCYNFLLFMRSIRIPHNCLTKTKCYFKVSTNRYYSLQVMFNENTCNLYIKRVYHFIRRYPEFRGLCFCLSSV